MSTPEKAEFTAATLECTLARAGVAIAVAFPNIDPKRRELLDALITEAFSAGRVHALELCTRTSLDYWSGPTADGSIGKMTARPQNAPHGDPE